MCSPSCLNIVNAFSGDIIAEHKEKTLFKKSCFLTICRVLEQKDGK